jgi:hypothetical protein
MGVKDSQESMNLVLGKKLSQDKNSLTQSIETAHFVPGAISSVPRIHLHAAGRNGRNGFLLDSASSSDQFGQHSLASSLENTTRFQQRDQGAETNPFTEYRHTAEQMSKDSSEFDVIREDSREEDISFNTRKSHNVFLTGSSPHDHLIKGVSDAEIRIDQLKA